jgi:hypothetical protein
MRVSIAISDPWELGERLDWNKLGGEVLRIEHDNRGGQALIRLDEPLIHNKIHWQYMIASPRHKGDTVAALESGNELHSGIVGIPVRQAESAEPFGSPVRLSRRLYFIGSIHLVR